MGNRVGFIKVSKERRLQLLEYHAIDFSDVRRAKAIRHILNSDEYGLEPINFMDFLKGTGIDFISFKNLIKSLELKADDRPSFLMTTFLECLEFHPPIFYFNCKNYTYAFKCKFERNEIWYRILDKTSMVPTWKPWLVWRGVK